jgi:hypothetical protein
MKRKKAADTRTAQHLAGLQLELMSNLCSTETGIAGVVIWASAGEFGGADRRHGPRIMVALGYKIAAARLKDAVGVRLTDPPEVLGELPGEVVRQAVRFIDKNRDVLLGYWRGEMSTREMLDLLERV